MSAVLEPKHDFIGRFMIGSGGALTNGVPVTDVSFYVAVTGDPFISLSIHIKPEEAIQIGKALMEHGERMVNAVQEVQPCDPK
jgi:hypothetical protein